MTDWDVVNPGVPRLAEDYAYAVDVMRTEPDLEYDPEDVPGWTAEGGMAGDGEGVQFDWTESLAALVVQVEDEVAQWRTRFPDLPIVWT